MWWHRADFFLVKVWNVPGQSLTKQGEFTVWKWTLTPSPQTQFAMHIMKTTRKRISWAVLWDSPHHSPLSFSSFLGWSLATYQRRGGPAISCWGPPWSPPTAPLHPSSSSSWPPYHPEQGQMTFTSSQGALLSHLKAVRQMSKTTCH